MTSRQRSKLAISVELDDAIVREINKRLSRLEGEGATKAMRNGFRRWTTAVRRVVAKEAPMGRLASTEKVRGATRPNVHLKFNVTTRIRGYSRGRVVWAAVGIKEIRGTYLTPHWYLRWVEYGHDIRRAATQREQAYAKARGAVRKREYGYVKTGRVEANPFLWRSFGMTRSLLLPMVVKAVDDQLEKEGLA